MKYVRNFNQIAQAVAWLLAALLTWLVIHHEPRIRP